MVKVVTREQWGARKPRSVSRISLPTPENWLHHTAGSEAGVSGMRRIQNYHMDTKGWSDIGYSWVYDKDQRTWYEGRGWGVSGAHTFGHNRKAHGFCVMGNFNRETVTDDNLDDIAWIIAEGHKAGKCIDKLTGGHRDVGSTSCPGSNLYNKIARINNKIQQSLQGGNEMADDKYKETTNKYFQPAWNWMIDNDVFSEHTEPTDVLTAEKFAVFFKRAVDNNVI